MPIIEASNLSREFEYYEKEAGLKGSISNLFKREKKIRHAVTDVSFTIEPGEMVGFIGPNGAGKTTTLKMLSGILYPSAGNAIVNGYVPWERKDEFKRSFSLVAGQKSQLWMDLPASDSLYLNKCIYEIPDEIYKKTVDELSDMLDVRRLLKVQVRRLSLGERMKMELIAALLHHPDVIFLDEPTIGLDILSQQSIRDYLKEYNQSTGATMVLTSHYIKDIEEMCRHTIVINHGHKVFDGSFSDLKMLSGNVKKMNLTCRQPLEPLEFERYGKVLEHKESQISLEIERDHLNGAIADILSRYDVDDFNVEESPIENSIEMIFRQ